MSTRKLRSRALCGAALSFVSTCFLAPSALASPVLFAGSGSEKVHSTQVAVLSSNGTNVVTIMPDYQGPLSPFAVIFPVPADVTPDRVQSLKREFVDRLETLSAPRFAEFWEMDPCEPGKAQQDWERSMKADDSSGFLGTVKTDESTKVARELLLDVKAQAKEGEYSTKVLDAEGVKSFLASKNLALPSGGEAALGEYGVAGYKFVVAEVDPNRVELVGGDRAVLSPIRFWTESDVSRIPARFGLASAAPQQELLLYTLVKDQRMQISNYPTKAAPTNVTVDFAVKERMGEFYAALHDRYLEKSPGTFLLEYAFSTADCGKPCPNEPLLPHELMSLGGDVLDSKLPKDEVRPKPPEPTEEELTKLKGLQEGKSAADKNKVKKEWEAEREELAARKALLGRHEYVLSRLHYRYGKEQLPKDPEMGPGGAVRGGQALPEGPEGAADTTVAGGEKNEFQTRFNNLHPNISKIECENPQRYRWGRAPSTYRGLRKIWVAEDLSRKNRQQIKIDEVIHTPVGDLGVAGKAAAAAAAEAPAPEAEAKEEKGCGCSTVGRGASTSGALGALLALAGVFGWRRRRAA